MEAGAHQQQAEYERCDDHERRRDAITKDEPTDSQTHGSRHDPQHDSRGQRAWCSPRLGSNPCAEQRDEEWSSGAQCADGIGGFVVISSANDHKNYHADDVENEPQRGGSSLGCHC